MPKFVVGTVDELTSSRRGLQRVVVDGRPAYVLTDVIGPVDVGDRVVVNTTAVDLGLGTGGFDVVHWNLATESIDLPGPGHIMKARYTSVQVDSGTWDTDHGVAADAETDVATLVRGAVVVGAQLHSHVGALAIGLAAAGVKVGFVMTDVAALPLALSDLVASLDEAGALVGTATSGQAFGGTHECVTVASGVAAMRHAGADVVIVGPGPGHVGTADPLAFSGLSLAAELDLLGRLGARVALATRWSSADPRERHRGLSHHSAQLLSISGAPWAVPVADGDQADVVRSVGGVAAPTIVDATDDRPDLRAASVRLGVDVDTMGRRLMDDEAMVSVLDAVIGWASVTASGDIGGGVWRRHRGFPAVGVGRRDP